MLLKPDTAPTWHEDVRFFRIEDAAGALVGQFYLDLYARETKRGGAWMDDAVTRRTMRAYALYVRMLLGDRQPGEARALFAELTPARLDLLDTLRRVGPCSIYALAKAAERDYSNVHTDVLRLEELGLIDRAEDRAVSVPFEAVEILVPLTQVA